MAEWEDEFTTPGTSAQIYLVLEVNVASQNIALNQTTVNWYLRMEERVNASPFNNNATSDAAASVNGSVYSSSNRTYNFDGNNETINVASGSKTITHTADGTKTISVSASYDGGNPLGTASLSSTMVLPAIPRATVPEVSPTSGNTAATFTITHDPADSSFYHDVAYSLDGIGGSYTDIQTNIVGTDTSTDWTPAHSLLPDSTGLTAYIRLITRSSSGGTIIGTEYVALSLTVPSSVKPTISSTAWADSQVSSPDLPTLMGGAGRFVQRWSKLVPTVTAAGAGGSSIVGIEVTQNGQTTDSGVSFANPIALSGSVPFSAVATDSRGRVNDAYASTVAVTAYNFPNLPTPTVTRTSDAGGTLPSPTGTYLKITPLASVSPLNFSGEKNLLEYQIRTSPAGAGTWTTKVAWTAAAGTTWTTPEVISTYLASSEYDVEVSIRDLFGKNGFDTGNTVKTLVISVPSESVDLDWNQGLGFGFGAYHQDAGAFVQVTGGLEADDIESGTVAATTITQGGNAVVDVTDVATTSAAGLVELLTDAEHITGTDTTRAGTAASSKAAFDSWNQDDVDRLDLLEYRPQGVVPSSITVGSGSASAAADGTVTFSGASSVSLNDVFDGLGGDIYAVYAYMTATDGGIQTRLRAAGTDDTSAVWDRSASYTTINSGPTASFGASASAFGYWNPTTAGTTSRMAGVMHVFRPAVADRPIVTLQSNADVNGDRFFTWVESAKRQSTGTYDGFTVYSTGGNLTGTIKVVKIA